MKRIVIAISAIALMLSINLAFARTPVPLLEPIDPDPVITQILAAIEDLYSRVSNLAGRMINVERSSSDDLVVVDANGVRVGTLLDLNPGVVSSGNRDGYIQLWSERLGALVFVNPYYGLKRYYFQELNPNLFFTTADCSGTPYSIDPAFIVHVGNPQTYYWTVTDTQIVLPQSQIDRSTGTCIATTTVPTPAGVFRDVTLDMPSFGTPTSTYTLPLRIIKD